MRHCDAYMSFYKVVTLQENTLILSDTSLKFVFTIDSTKPNRVMAFRMCNPSSIKGLLLNKNVKAVSPFMSNSGEKVIIVDKTNKAKSNKKSYLV